MNTSRITRVLVPVALIGAGMALGWFSHEVYLRQIAVPLNQNDQVGAVGGKVESNENVKGAVGETVSAITETGLSTPAPSESPIAAVPDVRRLLNLGRYEEAISFCNDPGIREHCDKAFLAHVNSTDVGAIESEQLAEIWLAEFPDHIDAAMLLVNRDFENEDFRQAVGRLAALESYQVENTSRDQVARAARKTAGEALIRLAIKDNQADQRELLAMLVEIDPAHGEWRYSLAGVEKQLGNLESALTHLTFILYDPAYGARASDLYDQILQDINLAEYVEVPLRKSGHQYLVDVKINLSQEITMVLDTGATVSAVDTEILRSAGLNVDKGRPIILSTAGGRVQSRMVRLNSIGVGGQVLTAFDVATLDSTAMDGIGLLGIDYLGRFSFVIDDKKRRLYLRRK